MSRKSWVAFVPILLGLGTAFHGMVTNTGPVGWLNALQQRMFGSYFNELSFAGVALGFWITGLLLLGLSSRLLGPGASRLEPPVQPEAPGGPGAPSLDGSQMPPEGKTPWWRKLPALGVLVALTWILGGALYGWHVLELRQDARATYQPITLTDGVPLPALASNHLALRGFPVQELGVVFKSGAVEDHRLIAMVGLGWEPDHPVPVVVKLDAGEKLPDQGVPAGWTPRGPEEVQLLVRRLGTVPTPALEPFRNMRAPLAGTVLMVSPVAARDGQPYLPDTAFDRGFTLAVCSLITLALSAWAGIRRLRRHRARKQSRPA